MASSTSCVTSSVVTGRRSTSSASSSRSRAASAASSETNGSSSSSRSGSTAKARASATRRARPSESSPGKCSRCAVEAERCEQRRRASASVASRRREPHVLLDRAPRQQPRLLEHHAERAVRGQSHAALEVAIEPGDDAQQRGLAAARRPDQRADLAVAERERQLAEHAAACRPRRRDRTFARCRPQAGLGTPAGDMSFKRLHQEGFDRQHDGDEGQSIGEDARDVEQLERDPDLEADAVRPAEQLDDQHDLPDQRQAGAGRGREIGRELRQHDMAQARPRAHAEHLRHLVERAVERARALAHRDGRDRQLVERDRRDRGGLGQAGPDIGEHDDHQRRQVEQDHQPGIGEPVGEPRAAHRRGRSTVPSAMAMRESRRDARQRRAEIEERARPSALRRRCASATVCGSGSSRAPASCEPAYQAAMQQRERERAWQHQVHLRCSSAGRTCRRRARAPGRRARRRRSRPARDKARAHRPLRRRCGRRDDAFAHSARGRSRARPRRSRRCAAPAAAIRHPRRRGSPWPGASTSRKRSTAPRLRAAQAPSNM